MRFSLHRRDASAVGDTSASAVSATPPGLRTPPAPPRPRLTGGAAAKTVCRILVGGLIVGAIGTGLALGGYRIASQKIGPPPLEMAEKLSTVVLDRNNRLLRAFTTTDGRWRLPVAAKDVDPRYLALLIAFEDRRFYSHSGVDPYAIGRAAFQLASNFKIVSGGSTLTMQTARLLDDGAVRSVPAKVRQIVRAIQLEQRLSKRQILDIYLRLAPFGGNIEGVRAASLAYFGKEPKRLSLGEAALLVALPQSPERRRPDRFAKAARAARDRVLDRAVEAGVIKPAEALRAKQERVPNVRREFPKLAPHLAEAEVALYPAKRIHTLTLDGGLQGELETLAHTQTQALGKHLSTAILVVDHTTGEILAHVGSADYLDASRLGAIDMTAAVRSPGSTLKPLIYGLAFERGLAHPDTLIEDRPTRFGTYTPKNFDESFHGTVTIREALGRSLNIPAVKVLAAVGPGRLAGRMRRAGVDSELQPGTVPSLAIALGGIGMRLQDLATLYAGIARGGTMIDVTHHRAVTQPATLRSVVLRRPVGVKIGAPKRILSDVAAFYVTDILKHAPPPPSARSGRIAYKTGTSYGYRDAWAVGYDGRHTIAVWVGRADGSPTPGLMGRTAAAPILFDAFARISTTRTPFLAAPTGVLRASGDSLPPPLKRFESAMAETVAGAYLDPPVAIAFPPDRSDVEVADRDTPLVLKAEGGALPLTWLADGAPIPSAPHRRDVTWSPQGEGFVKFSVIDAKGRVDRVTVRLRGY